MAKRIRKRNKDVVPIAEMLKLRILEEEQEEQKEKVKKEKDKDIQPPK